MNYTDNNINKPMDKAQLVFEIDRTDYDGVVALCRMAGADFSADYDRLWSEMVKQPIKFDFDKMTESGEKKIEALTALTLIAMKITNENINKQ